MASALLAMRGYSSSMPDHDLSELLEIRVEGGIVRCWHARSANDESEARAVLDAIDRALERSGIELLLLDSRDANRTSPEVQAVIWNWLSGHPKVRKVATLMHSKELGKSVRLAGAGQGVLIRAFHDEDRARTWLVER